MGGGPTGPVDLRDIQGDVLDGLPKKAQTYYFFRINTPVTTFTEQLVSFLPLITSSAASQDDHRRIKDAKKEAARQGKKAPLLEMVGVNISFSHKGLEVLGFTDPINDEGFQAGQLADAVALGDKVELWDEEFKKEIHGLILITGDCEATIAKKLEEIKGIFKVGQYGAGIVEATQLDGHVRPGSEDGHEHFGFNDGLSQPAVAGIPTPEQKGQETVAQGVILLGRDGDNGVASPGAPTGPAPVERPDWAIDGSLLAFRYLKQLVPEFNAFLDAHPLEVDPAENGPTTGPEFLGARLVGRWKSGAPIDSTPFQDKPELAGFDFNQDFRFDPASQARCPYAAHIRKTNPRDDLAALGGTEVRRMLRRGIQFGPEVTDEEKAAKKSSDDPKLERGLFFASYQSNLANGFQFQQKAWANSPNFPPRKVDINGNPLAAGIDPIIGVFTPRQLLGTDPDKEDELKSLELTQEWVIPRGGEYFFVPSISSLKKNFAHVAGVSHTTHAGDGSHATHPELK